MSPSSPETPEEPNIEPASISDLPNVWQRLLDQLESRGPTLHTLVSKGRLVAIEDGRAVIEYEPENATFIKMLDRNGKKDLVRDALSGIVGQSIGLRFNLAAAPVDAGASPAVATTATATLAPPPTRPAPARPAPVRRETPRPAETPLQSAAPVIRVTPELTESLKASEPLIKTLIDELGATIIKVEPADA